MMVKVMSRQHDGHISIEVLVKLHILIFPIMQ